MLQVLLTLNYHAKLLRGPKQFRLGWEAHTNHTLGIGAKIIVLCLFQGIFEYNQLLKAQVGDGVTSGHKDKLGGQATSVLKASRYQLFCPHFVLKPNFVSTPPKNLQRVCLITWNDA